MDDLVDLLDAGKTTALRLADEFRVVALFLSEQIDVQHAYDDGVSVGGFWTEGGAAGGPSQDRTTALLEALTARRAAQEKAREAGAGGTPEQGSVNLPPDPRDDVMIALLEQQKLLQEEIQEMRKKMGGKEGEGDNSKRQDSHKSGSRKSSKRRERHEESNGSSSESRSGESSFSSQSSDYTPPKKKRRYSFVDRIMDVAMPKLRTPTQLKHYDGTSDPVAHVNSFKAVMLYAGAPDEVMCRAFPSTLDGDAQLWFSDLPSGSISSFRQLSKRFTSYFATSMTIKRTAHCLKNVVQGKEESLKDFLIRFTKAARQIQGLKMEVALSYLTDNLRSKLFCCSITKKPPKTMAELLARSTKYIAFEEVQQAKEGGQSRREESEPSRSRNDGYRRKDRKDDRRDDWNRRERRQKPPRSFGPRFSSYTPLKKGRQEGTGDRRDQRRDDRNHRGGDQRHREDNTDNVAETIHVIAGGVVRGTEADPHTRKRQISAGDLEGAESPSGVMNTELVDPREREEERRPNPEGEMEAVALAEKDPTRTTKFQKLVVERVPREENDRADNLSKLASASARCRANPILKASLETPSIDVPEEVGVIFEKDDWRVPLIKYLAKGELPQEEEPRFGSAASASLIDGSTWGASDSSAKIGTESPTPSSAPSAACASAPGKVSWAIAFSLAGTEGDAGEGSKVHMAELEVSLRIEETHLPQAIAPPPFHGTGTVARKSLHSLSLFFQGILQLSILAANLAEPLKETLIFAHKGAVICNKFPLTISGRFFGTPQSLIFLVQGRGAILPYLQLLQSILQLDFKELLNKKRRQEQREQHEMVCIGNMRKQRSSRREIPRGSVGDGHDHAIFGGVDIDLTFLHKFLKLWEFGRATTIRPWVVITSVFTSTGLECRKKAKTDTRRNRLTLKEAICLNNIGPICVHSILAHAYL
ncbi:uncharacterized protein G2W53_023346 [Senna tora]|uniref:Retrotransposon gag domain-containing protein n=1 Tax=Senna tora TaxID=362788 RepID=A0A834TB75_9FABA|nr:uncharacterized protein G2W53_023346 [Senna tora]